MTFKEYSEQVKNDLTLDQVFELLIALGGEPTQKGDLIIAKTICHGGHSHKLYYYENTHLFRCYTDCLNAFDIYELILKIKKLDNIDFSLPRAVTFITNYFNIPAYQNDFDNEEESSLLADWKILNEYKIKQDEEETKVVELKIYDKKILQHLPQPRILPWEKEGITQEVIKHNNICYDPVAQGIVIPHYDKDNNLIGIRERTLIKENETNGKYKPAILNYEMYNHPLGFNLFNLNNSKNNISQIKKAFIFEGEKSCFLYQSLFGIENDLSVAVCGSGLINYQVQLLLDLGVSEIIVAFDKQFKEIGDDEWVRWTKKLKDIHNKYSNRCTISFMFDKWNLLGYKDSPIDRGKEVFLELFEKRVSL